MRKLTSLKSKAWNEQLLTIEKQIMTLTFVKSPLKGVHPKQSFSLLPPLLLIMIEP